MSLRKRLIINAGSNWAAMFVTSVVALVIVPIVLSKVGVAAYGVWSLLAYGLRYPMILENAFALAINRFVAYYRNDIKRLNRIVSASFMVLSLLAAATVVCAVGLSFFVSDIFGAITDEYSKAAQITCVLVGLTLATKMVAASFSGTLRGYQHYGRCNAVLITANLLRAALTIALLSVWQSIVALQAAFLLTEVVSASLMFVVAKRTAAGLEINIRLIDRASIGELWRYTSHSIARSGSSIVMYNTMTLLVGWAGTAADVAMFDIALRIPGFFRGFLSAMQVVLLPTVTSFFADGQIDKIKTVARKGTKVIAAITCMISVILFMLAGEILRFWLKDAFPDGTVEVMRVLTLAMVPFGLFGLWVPILVAMGYLRGLTIASISMVTAAIATALFLLQLEITVPIALAIALVVASWGTMAFWLPIYGIRKLELGGYDYFKASLAGSLLASVAAVAVLHVVIQFLRAKDLPGIVVLAIGGALVTLIFMLTSLRKENAEFLAALGKRLSTGSPM